jgi:hypothetical protein
MFAKQMNATTISLASSHASLVSHPNEIARLILKAVKAAAVINERYLKIIFERTAQLVVDVLDCALILILGIRIGLRHN